MMAQPGLERWFFFKHNGSMTTNATKSVETAKLYRSHGWHEVSLNEFMYLRLAHIFARQGRELRKTARAFGKMSKATIQVIDSVDAFTRAARASQMAYDESQDVL